MPVHYLRWISPNGEEQTCTLGSKEIILGRRSDSDVVLISPYVSRQHAKIVPGESNCCIVDLNSTHGTFVNGEAVQQQHSVTHGDRIELGRGRVELLFLTEGMNEVSTMNASGDSDFEKSMQQLTSILPATGTEHSNLEKISFILDFQYNWGKSFSPESTFQQILASALKLSGAERGFILLKRKQGFEFVVGMDGKGSLRSESEFQTSRSVVQQVASEGEAVIMTQHISGELAHQESIVAMRLRALACMPLKWISPDSEKPEVQGILYLDSTKAMHALSGLDHKILFKLAAEAANVFEKLDMIKAFEERTVFEKELALAQETQKALLPTRLPSFEGYFVTAFSRPTRYVGGDFYDFPCPLSAAMMTGVLADVSGKGISAALLSSLVQGALEMECLRGDSSVVQAIERINSYLCAKSQLNRFVTLFLFQLDPQGKGHYLSAGHNPAYLLRSRDGTVEELPSQNLILGAFDFARFSSHPIHLEKGDLLVVYSDGVTEAMNPREEMFGEERLIFQIQEYGSQGGAVLEEQLLRSLNEFTEGMAQTDDITCLIVQKD